MPALTATELANLEALLGTEYLKAVTNPESTTKPESINETTLLVAVVACEAWFSRRGYTLTRSNEELLGWVDLWARPRHLWGESERGRWAELQETYPPTIAVAAVTDAVDEGEANDRRKLSQGQLDDLDLPSSRTLRPGLRGSY